MTTTPVGMRCPECARQRTRVVRNAGGAGGFAGAPATYILIAVNVVAFLAEIGSGSGGLSGASGSVYGNFSLLGHAISQGEWYRIVTGGFLHAGFFHIALNMFALYVVGQFLEPAIGTPRFLALYFASLLAGSFGALLLTHPWEPTVGASGAIFGLFAATGILARGRGLNTLASEIGFVIVINLVFTLTFPGISIGGHLGGLIGGGLCGLAIAAGDRGRLGRHRLAAELIVIAAVGAVSFVAALAVA